MRTEVLNPDTPPLWPFQNSTLDILDCMSMSTILVSQLALSLSSFFAFISLVGLYRMQRWCLFFDDFSAHADGERRGLDQIGGRRRKGLGETRL